jgi:cytochrome b561
VLTLLSLLQLLLYIPMLALLGQGVLYVLAGTRREGNFFYQLLQLMSRPFTWLVRRLSPRQVADRHVPVATFCLLVVAYGAVTLERIGLCLRVGLELCR